MQEYHRPPPGVAHSLRSHTQVDSLSVDYQTPLMATNGKTQQKKWEEEEEEEGEGQCEGEGHIGNSH